jgi:Bacterial regulatory proteins, gntR family
MAFEGRASAREMMGPIMTGDGGDSVARKARTVSMPALGLDRASGVPRAILEGRLRPGARLPSIRTLAVELGSSRNTVLAAWRS